MRLVPNPIDDAWSIDSKAQRFLALADCFFEAAEREIIALLAEDGSKTIDALPSYFLFNHSVELFLKSMLIERTGKCPHTHKLSTLLENLQSNFQQPELQFSDEVSGYLRLMQVIDLKNDNYRYPHENGVAVKPQEFANIMRSIRNWMQVIRKNKGIFPKS